ncbi:MAG: hypothetical protein AAF903_10670 [Pseudomonadota bacterium]
MLLTDHLAQSTGLSARAVIEWSSRIPSGATHKKSFQTEFTLEEAAVIDIAAAISRRGFPRSLAWGIARYLKADFIKLIADEKFGVYVFAQPKDNEHDDWTFCVTEDPSEALKIADELEGVALFSGRVLLQQSLERLTAAQRELDA